MLNDNKMKPWTKFDHGDTFAALFFWYVPFPVEKKLCVPKY